jgi:hypothetical protein
MLPERSALPVRGSGQSRPPERDRRQQKGRDRGMVILETALGIGVLMVVAVVLLSGTRIGIGEIAVVSAARDAALAASRGAGAEAAAAIHRRLPGASIRFTASAGEVTATVEQPWGAVPVLGSMGSWHRASATARLEPGLAR